MKKIALSLASIAAVLTLVVGATSAYFSDSKVVRENTFATGAVSLGDVSGMPVTVNNLIPGVPQMQTVSLQYTGTTNADIWIGNRGNGSTPAYYFADVLYVKITPHNDSSTIFYNGLAMGLAGGWYKVATNVGAGWRDYDVTFELSSAAGNQYEGQTNTNTEFLIYAVQTGYPAPAIAPNSQLTDTFN